MEYKATYDSNDNPTLVETTVLQDGKRVPDERYVIKYSNNNPVSIEVYEYNGNDVGEIFYKVVNTYDTGGNRTRSESYVRKWDPGSGEYKLVNSDRLVATYDANGNQLFYESYSWDTSSGGWIGSSKSIYTYDANGNYLSYEYYWWNTSSGGWIGSSKSVYTHDANGNYLSYEYYRWNTSSGGWIEYDKSVYERNGYGDIILIKYYSWNNGWVYDSYTVYYPGEGPPDATERIGEAEPVVYIHDGVLYIRTVQAERIFIYSPTGSKVCEGSIPAGASALSAGRLPKGVLIVKGSSGWVKKVVK
jgi:hypothetical protein